MTGSVCVPWNMLKGALLMTHFGPYLPSSFREAKDSMLGMNGGLQLMPSQVSFPAGWLKNRGGPLNVLKQSTGK
jgi:hypothetical protein